MDDSLHIEERYQREVFLVSLLSKCKTVPFFFTVKKKKKSKQSLGTQYQRNTYPPKTTLSHQVELSVKNLTYVKTCLGDCPEQSVKFCELSDSRQQLLTWYVLAMYISCIF